VSAAGTVVETDLLIIGAGPTGLFAAYYAGFRGHRVAVVDSLPELGGQITAMYPEKQIFDVAGFPSVKGRTLVDALVEQAATAKPEYLLDRTANGLVHDDDGVHGHLRRRHRDPRRCGADHRGHRQVQSAAAAGRGGLAGARDGVLRAELRAVRRQGRRDRRRRRQRLRLGAPPAGRGPHDRAGPPRDAFRAHERTVQQVMESDVDIITRAQVTELRGDGTLESVVIDVDGETVTRPAQALVAALGFVADLGPLQQWGIEVSKRHVVVDSAMRTNLPRVFAAGDITEYDGKVG
jgi:thioredoxin reductase (NADPH)